MPTMTDTGPQGWRALIIRFALLTVGTLIGAMAVLVFLAPFNIAPAGVSGVAVILNVLFDTPLGLVVLLANIPIQYLAFRSLGGWRGLAGTIYVVLLYSAALDVLAPLFPTPLSDDRLLNALFGGIIGGVASGMIYRGGSTFGGTSTIARLLNYRYGIPLSSTAVYSNLGIVVLAGIFLGWEGALFATVVLVMEGAATDYVLEGPSVIRTATIVTDHPQDVSTVILHDLQRGVTGWEVTGMFTGQKRHILFVTVSRAQVNTLRQMVLNVDPNAFIVVGQGHVAYGGGFRKRVKRFQQQMRQESGSESAD
jgi:uncharacterized membrane-anchored protein YitT (DUF2179 family)